MTNLDIVLKLIDLQGEFSRTGAAVHNDWHATLSEVNRRIYHDPSDDFYKVPDQARRKDATNDELIKTLNDIKKELERDLEMYRSYCEIRYPDYIEAVDQAIIKLKELKDGE